MHENNTYFRKALAHQQQLIASIVAHSYFAFKTTIDRILRHSHSQDRCMRLGFDEWKVQMPD
jgi:hypothetical protein